MDWRQLFYHVMNMFNVLIVAYFFIGNGIYTFLMILSLISVWIHNRRLTYQGLDELRESVVTPPATIIMPAWNEQDIIEGKRFMNGAHVKLLAAKPHYTRPPCGGKDVRRVRRMCIRPVAARKWV